MQTKKQEVPVRELPANPIVCGFLLDASYSKTHPEKTKKSEPFHLRKSSDFVVVVHLQGLEPWAH